jgi:hypothetical protein
VSNKQSDRRERERRERRDHIVSKGWVSSQDQENRDYSRTVGGSRACEMEWS